MFTCICPECQGTMVPGAGLAIGKHRCEECGYTMPSPSLPQGTQYTNDARDGTSQDGDYGKTGSVDNAEWGR